MSVFSPSVLDFWQSQLAASQVLHDGQGLRLGINPELSEGSRLMLLTRPSGTQVVLTPGLAQILGLHEAPVQSEAQLHQRLEDAGITLHGADHLFYFPRQQHAALLQEPPQGDTRALSGADEPLFAGFQSCATQQDLDDAYVELEHWAVFGGFDAGRLVCAASMFPWEDGPLADLGILTLATSRGRGHGRRLVRAICRHALAHGYEPQYRCQTDNLPSVALARAAGLELFGQWRVISPDCEV